MLQTMTMGMCITACLFIIIDVILVYTMSIVIVNPLFCIHYCIKLLIKLCNC